MKKPPLFVTAIAATVGAFVATTVLLSPPDEIGQVRHASLERLAFIPEHETGTLAALRDLFTSVNARLESHERVLDVATRFEATVASGAIAVTDAFADRPEAVAER